VDYSVRNIYELLKSSHPHWIEKINAGQKIILVELELYDLSEHYNSQCYYMGDIPEPLVKKA